MPGIGLPSGGIGSTPSRALLWGGVGLVVVAVVFSLGWWRQASPSFERPVEVEATVLEDGFARSGGSSPTCQPLFTYELDGTTRTARPPTRDAAACVAVGETVTIVVDAQDPERIAQPAGERSVSWALVAALGLGAAMLVVGTLLRVRERRAQPQRTG